jgi:hypothetical protein
MLRPGADSDMVHLGRKDGGRQKHDDASSARGCRDSDRHHFFPIGSIFNFYLAQRQIDKQHSKMKMLQSCRSIETRGFAENSCWDCAHPPTKSELFIVS